MTQAQLSNQVAARLCRPGTTPSLWGAHNALFAAGAKPELGLLFCLLLPCIAAVASFENVLLAGVNYLVVITFAPPMLLLLMVLVKVALAPVRGKLWPGYQGWLIWYGVIWSSLLWGTVRDGEAIKHAAELSTPFLFAIAGGVFIRDPKQLRWLLIAFMVAVIPALACIGVWRLGLVELSEFPSGPALDARPHSMSMLPLTALAIAMFPKRIVLPLAFWVVCLLISAVEGSRGVTLSILILPLFHPTFRGLHWKLLLVLVIGLMGAIVFHLPPMQARLFPGSHSGTIADLFASKQSGMGRFEAWPIILEKAWDRPSLGHGVSSAFHFVPTIWDRMRSPHNEFLCIGYEMGLVGLAVYIAMMTWQLFLLRRAAARAPSINRIALAAVYLSLIALNMMALTDNPLSSNVRFLNPVFLLMGAGFGSLPQRSAAAGESEQSMS